MLPWLEVMKTTQFLLNYTCSSNFIIIKQLSTVMVCSHFYRRVKVNYINFNYVKIILKLIMNSNFNTYIELNSILENVYAGKIVGILKWFNNQC